MDDPMMIHITNNDIAEIPTLEIIEPSKDVTDVLKSDRRWNYGSTQTSDDMYLSGLMCE